jgi:FtsH-binding integral membrane protein
MIDLVIALCVAAFFLAAWSTGRYLPRALAACFPIAVVMAVVGFAATGNLSGMRDWLMAVVVICITVIVTLAGRSARSKPGSGGSSPSGTSG